MKHINNFDDFLNENLNDFKYDAVKKAIKKAIANSSVDISDINSNRYFIVCLDIWNNVVYTSSSLSRKTIMELRDQYKNDENIWKIYIEKPTVNAIVYLRKEWGWERKM